MMMSTRYGYSYTPKEEAVISSDGFQDVFSFRNWFGTTRNCVQLKRINDGATQFFGYDGDYLDITSIQSWASGSELEIVLWEGQLGILRAERQGLIPGMKLEIVDDKAVAKTTPSDGMVIKNIAHENVKVSSVWTNTGSVHGMVGCYQSSLTRLQFWSYNGQWLLGVNNSYTFAAATAQELTSRQIVTYNSDDINNVTEIHNQNGVSFSNSGNSDRAVFNLGLGMSDSNGFYTSQGEINEVVIYNDNNLISTVEQSLINAFAA